MHQTKPMDVEKDGILVEFQHPSLHEKRDRKRYEFNSLLISKIIISAP